MIPLIFIPSTFLCHAQGCKITFKKKRIIKLTLSLKFEFCFTVAGSHLVRGMPGKLQLGNWTSEHLTVNHSRL